MLVRREGSQGGITTGLAPLLSRSPLHLPLVYLISNQRHRSQEDSVYRGEPPQVQSRKRKKEVGGGVTKRGRAPFPALWGRDYRLPHDLLGWNAGTSDEGRTPTRQRN